MSDVTVLPTGGMESRGGSGPNWLLIGAIGVGAIFLIMMLTKSSSTTGQTTAAGTSINAALGSIQEQNLNLMGQIGQQGQDLGGQIAGVGGQIAGVSGQIADVGTGVQGVQAGVNALGQQVGQVQSGVVANTTALGGVRDTITANEAALMGELTGINRNVAASNAGTSNAAQAAAQTATSQNALLNWLARILGTTYNYTLANTGNLRTILNPNAPTFSGSEPNQIGGGPNAPAPAPLI